MKIVVNDLILVRRWFKWYRYDQPSDQFISVAFVAPDEVLGERKLWFEDTENAPEEKVKLPFLPKAPLRPLKKRGRPPKKSN